MSRSSRLTQSFLGLSDEAFNAVPALEKAIADTINSHIDAHHVSMGTVLTALACATGEMIVMAGSEVDQTKKHFVQILDAYTSAGFEGGRTGPDNEPSLVRRLRPWPKKA